MVNMGDSGRARLGESGRVGDGGSVTLLRLGWKGCDRGRDGKREFMLSILMSFLPDLANSAAK